MMDIKKYLGHMVEAEMSLKGYYGKVSQVLTGRIIYSEYNASLFFKPKGNRNKSYLIESEEDIHSVSIVRKDNRQHKHYIEVYNNKDFYEKQYHERIKREREEYKKQEQLRLEKFQRERQEEKERKQKEIETAKKLGGYDELSKEAHEHYKSVYGDDFYNENFLNETILPILNKLIHKSIDNVNEYPKHFFDKKRNKAFCGLLENKLNIKLKNTQKGNVELLNDYLNS